MIHRCRCQHCYGLREYLEDRGRPSYALLPASPGCTYTRGELKPDLACNSTYTCECNACKESRARLKAHRNQYRSGRA